MHSDERRAVTTVALWAAWTECTEELLGCTEGCALGALDGCIVGLAEGCEDGLDIGCEEGRDVGIAEGIALKSVKMPPYSAAAVRYRPVLSEVIAYQVSAGAPTD